MICYENNQILEEFPHVFYLENLITKFLVFTVPFEIFTLTRPWSREIPVIKIKTFKGDKHQ